MKMRKLYLFLFIVMSMHAYSSETDKPGSSSKKGDISGTIIDNYDQRPVEYATIALYQTEDKQLVTGGISDSEGFFRLKSNPEGNYYMTITFMGYKTLTLPDLMVLPDTRELELGNILLERNVKEIEGVDVIADQASVHYKIDKKVVNVSQQLTAKSGTAVDILENVPSVKVDIDGTVSLRGSGSFTVLIDGRPTVLEPSDALSQIPAGAIDNIEIITNPSAKYEPDGAAGIINVVTKKNKMQGMSGIVNANAGRFDNYGADFTLDTRLEKFYYYLGGDYNYRNRPGNLTYKRDVFYADGNDYHVRSEGKYSRNSERYSLKGGLDWNASEKDIVGFNLRVGEGANYRSSTKNYEEYFTLSPVEEYLTEDNSYRGGPFWEANLNYRHNFDDKKTHYIEAQLIADGSSSVESSENIRKFLYDSIASATRSTEDGPSSGLRLKLDYTQPFDWGGKVEAGWQTQLSASDEYNKVYEYDDTLLYDYVFQDLYSNHVLYTRNTHAAYATFGGEYGDFGYQAGLRAEYTYRYLELEEKQETFKIDRPDFFPTLHFSYKMPAEQQAMISYTRRIERPRGYYLEPFITYMDAYNVRQGNPDLQPEYINSFDLSYQKKFQQSNFFSVEGYYRITDNKIQRVMGKYADDTTRFLHSIENVGTDYALGIEFMLNYNPTKWYTANLMADVYDYRLEGSLNDITYEQHDFSWNARMNNTFKAGPNSRFQLDFMYQSPTVQAQGRSEGFFASSAAYKQDFLKRKLSATLQVRDVFGTWKHTHITEGRDFYQYTQYKPNTPSVILTLSYKLNNYRAKRGEGNNGGGGMDDGGGDIL